MTIAVDMTNAIRGQDLLVDHTHQLCSRKGNHHPIDRHDCKGHCVEYELWSERCKCCADYSLPACRQEMCVWW